MLLGDIPNLLVSPPSISIDPAIWAMPRTPTLVTPPLGANCFNGSFFSWTPSPSIASERSWLLDLTWTGRTVKNWGKYLVPLLECGSCHPKTQLPWLKNLSLNISFQTTRGAGANRLWTSIRSFSFPEPWYQQVWALTSSSVAVGPPSHQSHRPYPPAHTDRKTKA